MTNEPGPGGQRRVIGPVRFIVRPMGRWDVRDRLAVWTHEQAGEKIPQGHPSVTDAERAAAGRETLAALRQAILPENRSRAAAQYAAGGLPDGQEMVRVWRPRDPPVLLVGVHNAARMARSWPDRRSQQYLPGVSRRRFDAHMRFVTGEVVGWAAGASAPACDRRSRSCRR